MADFSIERSILARGIVSIAGVDEVGRGALCGPVVAAAVVFSPRLIASDSPPGWIPRIDDSKRLPARRREELASIIAAEADFVGVGWSVSGEVDRLNVFQASHAAMRRALSGRTPVPEMVLVDGVALRGWDSPQWALPQGDRRSSSIAAASIIAKVLRDALLRYAGRIYEGYGMAENKGYGTAGHYRALERLGACPFHRRSFQLQCPRTLFE